MFCLVGVFLFVCLFGWVLVLFGLLPSTFRDLSSSFAKLNDRLSCHGAHGMGEKKRAGLPMKLSIH